MEYNTQEASQPTTEQPTEEKPKDLMPGQEHEDELDFLGAGMVALVQRGVDWIKQLFAAK